MKNLEEEQRKMRERMRTAKPKKTPMERSSQRNSSKTNDIEALLKILRFLVGEWSFGHYLCEVSRILIKKIMGNGGQGRLPSVIHLTLRLPEQQTKIRCGRRSVLFPTVF
jgi:hypothetical protein